MKIPVLRALTPALCMLMNARMVVEEMLTPESIRFENASIFVVFCRRRG
jgi:hypothetical protein